MSNKAVVLLSGGLDSTTCLAIAKSQGYDCYALSISYGQKHNAELNAAKRIAEHYQVIEHRIIEIDIRQFGGSSLTDDNIDVPDYSGEGGIPNTYVPARNTIFLSIALGWAEVVNADNIFIGVSSVDYSGYPDCRPEYILAFQNMAGLATKSGVEGHPIRIHAPLVYLSKAETIRIGTELGVDYGLTTSCYRASLDGEACGECDSCVLRRRGFEELDIPDPTNYIAVAA